MSRGVVKVGAARRRVAQGGDTRDVGEEGQVALLPRADKELCELEVGGVEARRVVRVEVSDDGNLLTCSRETSAWLARKHSRQRRTVEAAGEGHVDGRALALGPALDVELRGPRAGSGASRHHLQALVRTLMRVMDS